MTVSQPEPPAEPLVGQDKSPTSEHDVRFSLANERTFLAWGRTSLAVIALGLAVVKLLPVGGLRGLQLVVGLGLILLGTTMGSWSYWNYQGNDSAIRAGRTLPRSRLPQLLLLTVVFGGLLAIVMAFVKA
jgi:putative membrane protein